MLNTDPAEAIHGQIGINPTAPNSRAASGGAARLTEQDTGAAGKGRGAAGTTGKRGLQNSFGRGRAAIAALTNERCHRR